MNRWLRIDLPFALLLKKPQGSSATRSSHEDCLTSHSLKWGLLPRNDVGRIVEHIREGEGRRKRNSGEGCLGQDSYLRGE